MAGHLMVFFFFFNDTATTEIYTLSLHDALPISGRRAARLLLAGDVYPPGDERAPRGDVGAGWDGARSEEHTSELQSRLHLVCRLLLEKKKKKKRKLLLECTGDTTVICLVRLGTS